MKQMWEDDFNNLYRDFEDIQKHCKYLESESNKLQSNWNSLREWLEARKELYNTSIKDEYKVILDKMNELEGKNKE